MHLNRIALLIVLLVGLLPGVVVAAGPWQKLISLPDDPEKVFLGELLGLSMDAERQRYYVVDSAHAQLVSFDREGNYLSTLNPGDTLKKPASLAMLGDGRLWIVERSDNSLVQVNLQRQQVRAFPLAYANGQPIFADKIQADEKHQLYVLDRGRGVVVRLDDNLKVRQTYQGAKGFKGFIDFRLTDSGLWALDGLSRSLTLFNSQGEVQRTVALDKELAFPVAFEVDVAGQFYLLDRHAGRIVVFDRSGRYSYDFLLQGKRPGQLWFPARLMFDWEGRLCVVNEGNGRVDIYGR